MKRTCLMAMAAIAVAMSGCSTRSTSYNETLHWSWIDIRRAVEKDSSLQQRDLNIGSGLAVTLAREEAMYWSNELAAKGIAIPEWEKRLKAISEAPGEFEGGSAAPLSKHLEMLNCLEEAIREMRASCVDGQPKKAFQ